MADMKKEDLGALDTDSFMTQLRKKRLETHIAKSTSRLRLAFTLTELDKSIVIGLVFTTLMYLLIKRQFLKNSEPGQEGIESSTPTTIVLTTILCFLAMSAWILQRRVQAKWHHSQTDITKKLKSFRSRTRMDSALATMKKNELLLKEELAKATHWKKLAWPVTLLMLSVCGAIIYFMTIKPAQLLYDTQLCEFDNNLRQTFEALADIETRIRSQGSDTQPLRSYLEALKSLGTRIRAKRFSGAPNCEIFSPETSTHMIELQLEPFSASPDISVLESTYDIERPESASILATPMALGYLILLPSVLYQRWQGTSRTDGAKASLALLKPPLKKYKGLQTKLEVDGIYITLKQDKSLSEGSSKEAFEATASLLSSAFYTASELFWPDPTLKEAETFIRKFDDHMQLRHLIQKNIPAIKKHLNQLGPYHVTIGQDKHTQQPTLQCNFMHNAITQSQLTSIFTQGATVTQKHGYCRMVITKPSSLLVDTTALAEASRHIHRAETLTVTNTITPIRATPRLRHRPDYSALEAASPTPISEKATDKDYTWTYENHTIKVGNAANGSAFAARNTAGNPVYFIVSASLLRKYKEQTGLSDREWMLLKYLLSGSAPLVGARGKGIKIHGGQFKAKGHDTARCFADLVVPSTTGQPGLYEFNHMAKGH